MWPYMLELAKFLIKGKQILDRLKPTKSTEQRLTLGQSALHIERHAINVSCRESSAQLRCVAFFFLCCVDERCAPEQTRVQMLAL